MSRINLPCNLSEEECTSALAEFDHYLLPDEEERIINSAMQNYVFYIPRERGKVRDCFCSRGHYGANYQLKRGENLAFFNETHGSLVKCPKCDRVGKILAYNRMQTFSSISREESRVTICRVGKNGALLLISGYASREYSWEDLAPPVEFKAKVMTYLEPGKRMQWGRHYIDLPEGGYKWDWMPESTVKEPFSPFMYNSEGDSFFIGAEKILDSSLKYCGLEKWFNEYHRYELWDGDHPVRDLVKFLSAYTAYPSIEIALRLGLTEPVIDLVTRGRKNYPAMNWNARKPAELLGLSKAEVRAFADSECEIMMVSAYKTAKKAGLTSDLGKFIELLEGAKIGNRANTVVKLARTAKCSLQQAVNYVRKNSAPAGPSVAVTFWDDYIRMAKELGYDFSQKDVVMPKDLRARHDDAMENLKLRQKAIETGANREFTAKLRKMYEFEMNGLCIVVPNTVDDIIHEGNTLSHCVGSYAARHFRGTLSILFLRRSRKRNTPFITIELSPRRRPKDKVTIRQIHGYQNEGYAVGKKKPAVPPSAKYKWFLDVWTEWLRNGSKRDKNGRPILPEIKENTA